MSLTLDEVTRLRKLFSSKKSTAQAKGIDFQFESADDFVNWWREQPAECAYCQTPIVLVKKLIEAGRLTVRKVKGEGVRGPVLELDRMDPKKPYSRLNCALACYYCNNDKSYIYDAKTYREYFGPPRKRHFRDLEAQVDKELSGSAGAGSVIA